MRTHDRSESQQLPLRVKGGSIIGAMLAPTLGKLAQGIEPMGRYSLYLGLLLVALTSFHLPGGVGSLADPILLFSLLCALLITTLGAREVKLSLFKAHGIGVGLFVFGVLISTAAASHNEFVSMINLLKFIFATSGTFIVCVSLFNRTSHLRTALGCWILSAAISSCVGVLQASLGESVFGYENRWRMAGLSQTSNGLGGIAALAIAPAFSLVAIQRDWLRRLLLLLAMVMCIAGVVVSGSRIGAVVAIGSLAVWAVMHYRLSRGSTALLAGLGIAAAGMAAFLHVSSGGLSIADRMSNADPESDAGVQERLYHYQYVIDEALENPMVGVGLAKPDAQVWGVDVHNTFLMALRAGGLFALIGVAIIVLDGLRKGLGAYVQHRSYDTKSLAIGLFAGMIGFVLNGMTDPLLYHRQVWIPMALGFSLYALFPRQALSRPHHRSRRSLNRTSKAPKA